MVKRKIVWSESALLDLNDILVYWLKNNHSDVYCKKLLFEIDLFLHHYAHFPESGKATKLKNIRFINVDSYLIFYKINTSAVEVIRIWDGRRDPKDLKLSK